MSTLTIPTLISLVGLPSSGKSTIAAILSERFDIKHRDIDDHARTPNFEVPPANDGTNPAIMKQDGWEMAGAYDILFGLKQGFLRARKSLVTTCTMSSEKHGQRRLQEMFNALWAQNPELRLRVIWCRPELSDEELQERIDARLKGGYTGATRSAARVRELAERFDKIVLPHLPLNTGTPYTPDASAMRAVEYILADQEYDNSPII